MGNESYKTTKYSRQIMTMENKASPTWPWVV